MLIHNHSSIFYFINFIAYIFEQKYAGFTYSSSVHTFRDPVYSLPSAAHWELVLSCLFTAAPGPSGAVPFPGAPLCALADHCALPPAIHNLPLATLMYFAGMSPSSQKVPTALVFTLVLCHTQLFQQRFEVFLQTINENFC